MALAVAFLLSASCAAADQLQALLPVTLGARVVAGPTWDGAVVVEPYDGSRVRLVVEALPQQAGWRPQLLDAGASAPQGPGGEALRVEAPLPLPRELASTREASPEKRLTLVVRWVSQQVLLVEGDQGAQDAVSVFHRRKGRCSGRANLAVALLRQLGVPARVVHGLLFRPQGPAWHRWGEAWLPGLGWRPFDPGVAVGVVGVRYVPMAGAGEGVSLSGVALLRLEEAGFLELPQLYGLRMPRHWPGVLLAPGRKAL